MRSAILLSGVNRPWMSLIIGVILMVTFATGFTKLSKDTRADAFLSQDNPVLVYKDKVKEIFGLSDPIVIAIQDHSAAGIFNIRTLQMVADITDAVNLIDNVNQDRTISLAIDKSITGTVDGMDVKPFLELLEEGTPKDIAYAVQDFPVYEGILVSRDRKMTLIILELFDDDLAELTYQKVMEITSQYDTPHFVNIYVAGEGAVLGFLSHYIDEDASRLNPLALIIITLMLIIAFRSFLPALLGNFVIIAAVSITVGTMSHLDIPFYVITNAMPVILIGIAIADSIHIFSFYYECRAKFPDKSAKEATRNAVVAMWKPVTLTTITTMAGFLGLYASAYMPPFEYFGLFTALGVFIAWYYSIFVLPALMVIVKPKASRTWVELKRTKRNDFFARLMVRFGGVVLFRPVVTVAIFAALTVIGLKLSSDLVVNENRINSFHKDEPLYIADHEINKHMDGTNTIDVVVETPNVEGIFEYDVLLEMQAFQDFAETLAHVNGSVSVVDYLKQMNKALNEGEEAFYRIPEGKNTVAQFFLIYSASSDATDFENLIDYDYRRANIRLNLDTSEYVAIKPIVEELEVYIAEHFKTVDVSVNLSGRVTVNYHWIKDLGASHFLSVAIALSCVLLVSSLLFRSLSAGLIAVLPVACSILLVYAAMVMLDVDLGIGTSMFASVAIGLGVDFSIHTIDRLKEVLRSHRIGKPALLAYLYPSTGRALLFNYLAIAFGFGVLVSSNVVPLNNFGTIVVLAVTTSFIASMALIPALVMLIKPRFFFADTPESHAVQATTQRKLANVVVIGATLGLLSVIPHDAAAQTKDSAQIKETSKNSGEFDALEVMHKVNEVFEGESRTTTITMTLRSKNGDERTREVKSYRRVFEDERKTFLVYQKPANVDGTSFLTYDYFDGGKTDDQWLYLPALRKVKRISVSDRGDFFLGTDFTYEDIKKSGKVEITDFHFASEGIETIKVGEREIEAYKVRATPKSPQLVKELAYGDSFLWVNPENWIVVKGYFEDAKGRPIRTYYATEVIKVEDIWTLHVIEAFNHKTGHYSKFEFSDIDYLTPIDGKRFKKRAMKRS